MAENRWILAVGGSRRQQGFSPRGRGAHTLQPPTRDSAPVPKRSSLLLAGLLLCASHASAAGQESVIPVENVRVDYAQVLRVEPVYQTLHASRSEQQCDPPADPAKPQARGLSRLVGAVRNALGNDHGGTASNPPPAPASANCRTVQVQREFRRPIAYDVDYIYKGMKYRSRLAEDPGNRLRVRVSVTPFAAPGD